MNIPKNLKEPVAVAVSGGADSLAAALIFREYYDHVIGLTVDHRLRDESAKEAKYVKNVLKKFDISHHTLVWSHEKIISGIQEKARKARYELLNLYCLKNKIPTLITAHHIFDQFETVIMRLKRGSSITGLSGIAYEKKMSFGTLIRPFLNINPQFFKEYLKAKNITWISDPSNENTNYERISIRKNTHLFKNLGIHANAIYQTADFCSQADSYIEEEIQKHLSAIWDGNAVDLKAFEALHPFIAKKILQTILHIVSNKKYKTGWEKINTIYKKIKKNPTGGGCIIKNKNKKILILKDPRII